MMAIMKENIILTKTYKFALDIVLFLTSRRYPEDIRDITRQLLRWATSVGANTEEVIGGQSRKDFVHKLQIAYKEVREARYWLRLMKDADLMKQEQAIKFIDQIDEILKIMTAILNTTKAVSN